MKKKYYEQYTYNLNENEILRQYSYKLNEKEILRTIFL